MGTSEHGALVQGKTHEVKWDNSIPLIYCMMAVSDYTFLEMYLEYLSILIS